MFQKNMSYLKMDTLQSESWCLVESDPAAFTELLRGIGVRGVQVEEVYSLDDSLDALKPVYGLIFLFRWREKDYREETSVPVKDSNVYFASQVIENACATQAVLSIVLNCEDLDIGDNLRNFKAFTKDFPPSMKGLTIGNSDIMRKVHNSFARPNVDGLLETGTARHTAFTSSASSSGSSENDVYHFVSYVPVDGFVYELDGLSRGPIRIGPCSKDNWLAVAKPAIQQRIKSYSSSEIHFNLMGVIRDRHELFESQLQAIDDVHGSLTAAVATYTRSKGFSELHVDWAELGFAPPVTERDANALFAKLEDRRKKLKQQLIEEEAKRERQRLDNIRRRHNYFPFIVEMLKILGNKGDLSILLRQAQQPTK